MNLRYLKARDSSLAFLIFLLLIKAAVLICLIVGYKINLAPDEAQYWTWSRALDWGYYSKPPAIAWQIWLSTSIFGNNELGVRLGAVVIGFLLAIAVYRLAKAVELKHESCFWAAIIMAFSPLGIYLSFVATTDGGAIVCLTMALAVIAKGIHEKRSPNYPLAGLWILLGALYKWIAFALWPFALLGFLFFPSLRKWSVLWGILISLAALFPSLYWNANHEWATFKHVGSTIAGQKGGNFFDFLGAQIGLLSPIYFALLIISYFYLYRSKNRSLWFCASLPAVILCYLAAAFFKKIQPNWAAYLYPPAMLLIAWIACERLKSAKLVLPIGTWLSIIFVGAGVAIPWIQSHTPIISYKINPFRQSMGSGALTQVLESVGYRQETDFLFGDKYQTASLLSFYAPNQKKAYFFNLGKSRKNQFSYWPQMHEKELGNTGFFVVIENKTADTLSWYETYYCKKLAAYFKQVEYVGGHPLFSVCDEPVKHAIIFKCIDYLGHSPQDPEKY